MAGVECQTLRVEHEHPYEAIINTARSRGCDLIVMASHGRRGIGAMILGSETTKVLTHCKNSCSRSSLIDPLLKDGREGQCIGRAWLDDLQEHGLQSFVAREDCPPII